MGRAISTHERIRAASGALGLHPADAAGLAEGYALAARLIGPAFV